VKKTLKHLFEPPSSLLNAYAAEKLLQVSIVFRAFVSAAAVELFFRA
jgi:hypothetical protein